MLKAQEFPNTKTLNKWTSRFAQTSLVLLRAFREGPPYNACSAPGLLEVIHDRAKCGPGWDATVTQVGSRSLRGYLAAEDAPGIILGPREASPLAGLPLTWKWNIPA